MGVETGLPPMLLFLARVNPSLTNAGGPLPSLLILPPRQGGDAPGMDLMASQIDVQVLTINNLARFSLFLWCHLGKGTTFSQNVSQAETTRGDICLLHDLHISEHIPDCGRSDKSMSASVITKEVWRAALWGKTIIMITIFPVHGVPKPTFLFLSSRLYKKNI